MTMLVFIIYAYLLATFATSAAFSACNCPPSTTEWPSSSSTVMCAFPHSPFRIYQDKDGFHNNVVELHYTEDLNIPNTTSIPSTQTRINRVFFNHSQKVSPMYLSTMEREHDGTSIVLLVLSPGISNVEALTNAIDLLAETCEVSQQQQQQQQPSSHVVVAAASETYSMVITDHYVYVGAHSLAGLHAGLATLETVSARANEDEDGQDVSASADDTTTTFLIPSMIVPFDAPKYAWRGFHLDVARHFFEMKVLMDIVKRLGTLKLNVLHLHLTDDQGWRLPLHTKWHRLTTVGSQRMNSKGEYYGGHYTKEDIAQLVQLCQELNIQLVPEVDLPGHAGAILASYPSLGCRTTPLQHVPTKWGELDYALCLRHKYDKVLQFSYDMLEHVQLLFPTSSYIHVGGDEIPSGDVTNTALIQFFRSIATLLNKKGKKMIVWDEVLSLFQQEQKEVLPNNMVIQAWQSTAAVRKALLSSSLPVIASPQEYVYLNKKGTTSERIASFNPMPCSVDTRERQAIEKNNQLMGGSLCLWTEYVNNVTSLYEHAFPRTEAFAAALWSPPVPAAATDSVPKQYCIFTSMKTYLGSASSHAVENVADDDLKTMFWSEGAPSKGDHITVRYSAPGVSACGISIVTGGDRNQDRCRHCTVEINGNFLAKLSRRDGSLHAMFHDDFVLVREIRLVINQGGARDWLMVPEISLISCDGTEQQERLEL